MDFSCVYFTISAVLAVQCRQSGTFGGGKAAFIGAEQGAIAVERPAPGTGAAQVGHLPGQRAAGAPLADAVGVGSAVSHTN